MDHKQYILAGVIGLGLLNPATADEIEFPAHEPTELSISHSSPKLYFDLSTQGDEGLGGDASEIARQTSNPLGGDFMVLINEVTWDFEVTSTNPLLDGASNVTQIFQPVIPISMADAIGPNWILVNRPTFVYAWDIEVPNPAFPRPSTRGLSGFADISTFSLLGTSVPSDSKLLGEGDRVLAAGFSLNIPVGRPSLRNEWAIGPAAVAAYIGKKGILGGLVQTQFDIESGGDDYNVAFFQPFYYLNLQDGWQIGGAPLWSFDLDDSSNNQIPIGLGVQKTQVFNLRNGGKLPIRFGLEYRYHVDRNRTFGTEQSLVFQITPIIPNVIGNWIKGCPAMSVGGC